MQPAYDNSAAIVAASERRHAGSRDTYLESRRLDKAQAAYDAAVADYKRGENVDVDSALDALQTARAAWQMAAGGEA